MATPAQIAANRENAQHSSGPTSNAGKEVSSRNNFRHGLSGIGFSLRPNESPEEYQALSDALRAEHQPQTTTEDILVNRMAQHHWLAQRAFLLQSALLCEENPLAVGDEKSVELMLRYQAHHERLFQNALATLLKLRSEKRKEQIGFESQQRAQAQEQRRENDENRKTQCHINRLAIDKERLEAEKATTFLKASAVAKQLGGSLGPEMEKKAA